MGTRRKAIRAAHLDQGVGRGTRGPVEILVVDGRIADVAIGRQGGSGTGSDCDILSFPDATVLPGLVNAHVHLALDGGGDPMHALRGAPAESVLARMRESAVQCIETGVTTVRECGAPSFLDIAVRAEVNAGALGPRVVASGAVITTRGGHLAFMGIEADTQDEVRAAVRKVHEAGADFVKVIVSGGRIDAGTASDRHLSQYSEQVLACLVEQAHALGMRVAAHAHATAAIAVCAAAGVDSIEHCLWLSPGGQRYDPALADLIAERGIFVVPTLGRSFPRPSTGGSDDPTLSGWDMHAAVLRRMRAAGVVFAAGGDSGASFTPQSEFPHELELFMGLGMTASQAVEAGTSAAARCLGVDEQVGSVEAGKLADLLIVPGDVACDLAGLWHPLAVFKGGELMPPDRGT